MQKRGNMNNYSGLLQVIKLRVCKNNRIAENTLNNKDDQAYAVWHRIAQIYTLECVLHEYRKTNATRFVPLENEKALHHMILSKTNWILSEIKSLSFNECIFVIADKLTKEHMSPEAFQYIDSLGLPACSYPLDDFSEADWAPGENAAFFKTLVA